MNDIATTITETAQRYTKEFLLKYPELYVEESDADRGNLSSATTYNMELERWWRKIELNCNY